MSSGVMSSILEYAKDHLFEEIFHQDAQPLLFVCLWSSIFRKSVYANGKSQSHFVSRSPSPSSASSWDWGRAPGLVLGGIWLAQDSVSSLHSLTSHTQSSHRVSPQLSLCWPLIGRPPPTLASDWPLASPGLDSGPSLHWSLAARCTAGHPGNFYLHQKCFNSSNKLHSKLVLIRICPVMPFERESDTNLICPCHSTLVGSLSFEHNIKHTDHKWMRQTQI